MSTLGFVHRWEPGASPGAPTILLLHGTGGNEHDLIGLGQMVAPGAALLSPRGQVLEGSAPRFFRRLAEGVFDIADLHARTTELARFVEDAAGEYGFDAGRTYAVGFSNGANIAASLLLSRPGLIAGGVLLRAMVPFEPETPPSLAGTSVLLAAGRMDPIVPSDNSARLAEMLRVAGADVTLEVQLAGHNLVQRDVELARDWLAPRLLPSAVR